MVGIAPTPLDYETSVQLIHHTATRWRILFLIVEMAKTTGNKYSIKKLIVQALEVLYYGGINGTGLGDCRKN
jgi:hypothetical protein